MPRLSNNQINYIFDLYQNVSRDIDFIQDEFNDSFNKNVSKQTIIKHTRRNEPAVEESALRNENIRNEHTFSSDELEDIEVPKIYLGYSLLDEDFYRDPNNAFVYVTDINNKEIMAKGRKRDIRILSEVKNNIIDRNFIQWCRNMLYLTKLYDIANIVTNGGRYENKALDPVYRKKIKDGIDNLSNSKVMKELLLASRYKYSFLTMGAKLYSFYLTPYNEGISDDLENDIFVVGELDPEQRYSFFRDTEVSPPGLILKDEFYKENANIMCRFDTKKVIYFLNHYSAILDNDVNLQNIRTMDSSKLRDIINNYTDVVILRDNEITPIPYKNYSGENPLDVDKQTGNCVLDYILYLHGDTNSTNYTNPDDIKQWFKERDSKKYCTTLDAIKNYCAYHKDFNVYLLDIFGRCIYKRKVKTTQKRPIQAIIYDDHIYHKKKGERSIPLFDKEIEKPVIRSPNNDLFKDNIFVKEFQKNTVNNYTHESERSLRMKALKYCKPRNMIKRTEKDVYDEHAQVFIDEFSYYEVDDNDWSKTKDFISYDINSAYYTTLFKSRMDVPIFSVADKWILRGDDQFPKKGDFKSYYYVELDYKEFDSVRDEIHNYRFNHIHELGFTNNIMFYKTALVLIDLMEGDSSNPSKYIKSVKIPTNVVAINDYKDVLQKILRDQGFKKADIDESKADRKKHGDMFRLCNGLMGKITESFKQKECDIPGGNGFNYVSLLDTISKERGETAHYDEENHVYTITGKKDPDISGLNSLSFYNYIVDMTNIRILHQIQDILEIDEIKNDRNFEIYKIITDSIVVDSKYKDIIDDEFNRNSWKLEDKEIKFYNTNFYPPNIVREIEYDDFSSNLTIISGTSGTGKTHMVKNEYKYDYAASSTNMCCRNMDTEDITAQTIHRLFKLEQGKKVLGKNLKELKYLRGKTVWIDEYSMMSPQMYDIIAFCIKKYDTRFILTGDPYQLEPVGYEYYYSRNNFKFPLKGKEIVLTHNYRFNEDDTDILNNITERSISIMNKKNKGGLIKEMKVLATADAEDNIDSYTYSNKIGCDSEIKTLVKDLSSMFTRLPLKDILRTVDIHLCYTNRYKNRVNNAIMNERDLTFSKSNKEVSNGVLLILSEKFSDKKSEMTYQKNEMFEVFKTIDEDDKKKVVLIRCLDSSKITVSMSLLFNKFNIGYARTVHCVQGQTLKEKLCIHEIYKMKLNMIYTAITRGIRSDLIMLVSEYKYEMDIIKYKNLRIGENKTTLSRFKTKTKYSKEKINSKLYKKQVKHERDVKRTYVRTKRHLKNTEEKKLKEEKQVDHVYNRMYEYAKKLYGSTAIMDLNREDIKNIWCGETITLTRDHFSVKTKSTGDTSDDSQVKDEFSDGANMYIEDYEGVQVHDIFHKPRNNMKMRYEDKDKLDRFKIDPSKNDDGIEIDIDSFLTCESDSISEDITNDSMISDGTYISSKDDINNFIIWDEF